jgi:hypothetical protein
VIKRVLLAVSLALPLSAAVLPHALAAPPAAATPVQSNRPMFCVWNQQLDISYCQYTLPRI